MCGSLCLQHKVNEAPDSYVKDETELNNPENSSEPMHVNFI